MAKLIIYSVYTLWLGGSFVMSGLGIYYDISQTIDTPVTWLEFPLWFWGFISLILFCLTIIVQLKHKLSICESPKTAIDVKPKRPPVGREITLVVHNKGNTPAIFSANMNCSIIPGERQLTKIMQMVDASMIWESSGTDTETIDADQSKVLKVCYVEKENRNGEIILSMNFYKRELSKPEVIPCADFIEGNTFAPKVQIDITFRANLPVKGKSEWKYEINYVLPTSFLHIKSR